MVRDKLEDESRLGQDVRQVVMGDFRRGKTRDFYYRGTVRLKEHKAVPGKNFDAITCASALFLLEGLHTATKSSIGFHQPGDTLAVDINDRTKAQNSHRSILRQ